MKQLNLFLIIFCFVSIYSSSFAMLPQDDEYEIVILGDSSTLNTAPPDTPPTSSEFLITPESLPPVTNYDHCLSACLCCVAAPYVAANLCCECAAMCTESTACCVMSSRGGDCCCTSMLSLLSWIFCCPCSCYCCIKKYQDVDAYNDE